VELKIYLRCWVTKTKMMNMSQQDDDETDDNESEVESNNDLKY